MVSALRFLWRHRLLVLHTTSSDVRARYTGSLMGSAWAVLSPLLLLSVYLALYVFILQVRLPGSNSRLEYALVIFSGLVPWLGFSEATASSVGCLVANSGLLRNTSFPAPAIPVKAVLAGMIGQAVGLVFLLSALAYTGHFGAAWLFLPVAVACQLLLSLGLGWILSVLNVLVRDLSQSISVLLLLMMFVSPIAFTAEFVATTRLRALLWLNPLSYIINLYRVPLVYGRLPALTDVVVAVSLAAAVFGLGYRFFVRVRPHLTDYV